MLAVGLIAYEIGLKIRKPVRDWFAKLFDVSQPTDPNATPGWLTEPAPPEGMTINQTGQMGTEGARLLGTLTYTDTRVSGSGCSAATQREPTTGGYKTISASGGALKYTKGERAENDCGWLGAGLYVLRTMPESGKEADADWELLVSITTGGWRPPGGIASAAFEVEYEAIGDPSPDLPLPIWEPVPGTKPLPQVEPSLVPERKKAPVIAPPVPVTVPDAQPVPSTEPQPLPISIPSPVLPAVFPAVEPETQPSETQTTTNAGALTPKTPAKVVTTPKDVHLFGNSGGRVSGSTMRATTTAVAQEVGRLEQKLSSMNSGFPSIGGLAELLFLLTSINDLLNSQKDGTTYELKSVCECTSDDENCEEETTTVETAGGYYVDAILSRLDALPTLLQAQKDYKQPICIQPVEKLGDFRTLAFISDQKSEFGNDRLRKQFRYRSQSSNDLGQLVDHWKDFAWEAGAVCVQHKDAWWGTPQVWAESAEEGKRVLRHAGSEAGINPDDEGRYVISGSTSPRYGQSGTMRICTKGGYYWITERLGSNNRPTVAKT